MNLNLGDTQLIIQVAKKHGLPRNQLAYVLATAYWESGSTMKPVREAFGKSTEDTIRRLDNAKAKGQLPWVKKVYWQKDIDGKAWFGRGYVQLTWKDNYIRAGHKLNIDLWKDPDRVMEPAIAAEILVRGMKEGWFTSKRLDQYITSKASDYVGARRIVNGMDKATVIAELAREYENDLTSESHGEARVPVVNTSRAGVPPRTSLAQSNTFSGSILGQVGNAVAAWQVLPQLEGTAQTIAVGAFALVALSLILIKVERVLKWKKGDR